MNIFGIFDQILNQNAIVSRVMNKSIQIQETDLLQGRNCHGFPRPMPYIRGSYQGTESPIKPCKKESIDRIYLEFIKDLYKNVLKVKERISNDSLLEDNIIDTTNSGNDLVYNIGIIIDNPNVINANENAVLALINKYFNHRFYCNWTDSYTFLYVYMDRYLAFKKENKRDPNEEENKNLGTWSLRITGEVENPEVEINDEELNVVFTWKINLDFMDGNPDNCKLNPEVVRDKFAYYLGFNSDPNSVSDWKKGGGFPTPESVDSEMLMLLAGAGFSDLPYTKKLKPISRKKYSELYRCWHWGEESIERQNELIKRLIAIKRDIEANGGLKELYDNNWGLYVKLTDIESEDFWQIHKHL